MAALSSKEALAFLGLSESEFKNFVKAGEIKKEKIRGRFAFEKSDLEEWKRSRAYRSMTLSREDYMRALEFAIQAFYGNVTKSHFARQQQRDAGQYITNQVQGKLGEIAFVKFLKDKFNIEAELDFSFREGIIPGQDITEIRRGRIANPPRIRVGIKATKQRNMFLALSTNEVERDDRRSDIYVLVRVGLFPNHILRLLKDSPNLRAVQENIPPLSNISAEIAGYVEIQELDGPAVVILGNKMSEPNYFKTTGDLKKSENNWLEFTNKL